MRHTVREKVLLNNDWKFMHGDFAEASQLDFKDEGWYDVGIPHSFGIPYYMENEFYVGYGCYRKWIDMPDSWQGKRLLLEFQGVFQVAQVYVNGQLTGEHAGGYTAFCVDVTSLMKPGRNLLMVRVNNEWSPVIAPRAGEHVFQGGIYRDVALIVTDPVHVAWYGTFVTAGEISQAQAMLRVETEIVNDAARPCCVQMESVIRFKGEQVAKRVRSCKLQAGETKTFREEQIRVDNPSLWSPESPALYTLETTLYHQGEVCDQYLTPFGIREVRFDAKEGFFLNGAHYPLLGANVHQDHAGWSDAVTQAGIRRDVQMIKECGMNFIRGSHYPHHTAFAQACDEIGILFWSEMCFWGTGGPLQEGYWASSAYPIYAEHQEAFEASCITQLREMIRTNRNHPSILAWSMCNEVFFCDPAVTDKAKALLRRMVDVTHEEDPSRVAAVGGVQRGGFDLIGDVAGYNGDGASLFIDPGFPNMVTEYGSFVSQRPGVFEPHFTDNTDQDFPWRSGKSLWCGFHHGSIFSDMGAMGMIDYSRLPLRTWYWYREKLRGIPAAPESVEGTPIQMTIDSDRDVISTDGTEDCHLVVRLLDAQGNRVNTACDVLLEVLSGDGRFPEGRRQLLTPRKNTFLDGMGAMEMRACFAGRIVVRASCGELSCEKCITAVGGEAWDGCALRLPEPPPWVMGAPECRAQYDLAAQRPVFASENVNREAVRCIVDTRPDTVWTAPDNAWAMIDLEGSKAFQQVVIRLAAGQTENVALSLSTDGHSFTPVALHDAEGRCGAAQVEGSWRYVRIEINRAGVAVQAVSCMVG